MQTFVLKSIKCLKHRFTKLTFLTQIVKTHHKEQLLETLKDENALLDTKLEEMIVYFQAGVLVGDSTSAFNLALCYHMGRGTTQDLEKVKSMSELSSMQLSSSNSKCLINSLYNT